MAAEPAGAPFPLVGRGDLPGATLEFLSPPQTYPSRPPALWNFRCLVPRRAERFAATTARTVAECPGEFVLRLRDARIVDGKFVFAADGTAALESFVDLPRTPAGDARIAERLAGGESRPVGAGAPVVHIFKAGAANFGHVLVDILPKLVHLAAIGIGRCRIPLPAEAAPLREVVDFAAHALDLDVAWLPCPRWSVLEVAELLWIGPVSRHDALKSPTLLAFRRRLLDRAPATDGPRRLFVTRPAGAKRPIAELPAVEALMRAQGFAVVDPATLGFADEIALFRGATEVIGLLGAGMTNALWMAPRTSTAVFDPGFATRFFWDLACLGGQHYATLFAHDVGRFDPALLTRPWSLPPALAEAALDWLHASR